MKVEMFAWHFVLRTRSQIFASKKCLLIHLSRMREQVGIGEYGKWLKNTCPLSTVDSILASRPAAPGSIPGVSKICLDGQGAVA